MAWAGKAALGVRGRGHSEGKPGLIPRGFLLHCKNFLDGKSDLHPIGLGIVRCSKFFDCLQPGNTAPCLMPARTRLISM